MSWHPVTDHEHYKQTLTNTVYYSGLLFQKRWQRPQLHHNHLKICAPNSVWNSLNGDSRLKSTQVDSNTVHKHKLEDTAVFALIQSRWHEFQFHHHVVWFGIKKISLRITNLRAVNSARFACWNHRDWTCWGICMIHWIELERGWFHQEISFTDIGEGPNDGYFSTDLLCNWELHHMNILKHCMSKKCSQP